MLKSILLLIALVLGMFLPQLDAYTFTLRPILMILLFFSFLNIRVDASIFSRKQAWIALLLPPVGVAVYFLGSMYDENLGLTLLLIGLAPTAIITPVLAEMMRRRVEYMVGAIIITHAVFAISVPFILPWLLGVDLSVAALGRLVLNIGGTIVVPLAVGQAFRKYGGPATRVLRRMAPFGFALFLFSIAVAAGSLSHYLLYESDTPLIFIGVAGLSALVLMLINFAVGAKVSPPGHAIEGSLAFGRKNTMLSIWIALEYINPLVVLGPMLYILLQNVFVAGQIVYVERKEKPAP